MTMNFRRGGPQDAAVCGRIIYDAFDGIARRHNFPPELPDVETGVRVAGMLLGHPKFYCVVAEQDGKVAGSGFMDERSIISAIGPVSVAPGAQDSGIGRQLMLHLMERANAEGAPGVRLVQSAYHMRSLSLYTKLGFDSREELGCIQGTIARVTIPGRTVRAASAADVERCNQLCRAAHGFDRGVELGDAVREKTAIVVEHAGRITGYATFIGYFGHAIAEANDDLQALIAASKIIGPGFLIPVRNGDLMRWCFANGLRLTTTMTLMTTGIYQEPRGAWLPSISY